MSGLVSLRVKYSSFDIDTAIRRAALSRLATWRWWYRSPELPKRPTIAQCADAGIRKMLLDIFEILQEQSTYIRMELDGVRFNRVSLASFGSLSTGAWGQDYSLFSAITTNPQPKTRLSALVARRYYLLFTTETTSGPDNPWRPALPDEADPSKMLVWLTDPEGVAPEEALPGLIMTMLPSVSAVTPALSSEVFRN